MSPKGLKHHSTLCFYVGPTLFLAEEDQKVLGLEGKSDRVLL